MVVEAITKVAIIGANGQLGTDLLAAFKGNAIPFTHSDIDVTNPSTFGSLRAKKPDVIINAAAYVKVDMAEQETEAAAKTNIIGAFNIARLSKELNAVNIYISTDYVFDGNKKGPYTESDAPNPLNFYGLSKYAGEIATQNYSQKYYIFRMASLFGKAGSSGKGGNFIETMINKAKNKEVLNVVDDMVMSPTYTKDAAELIKKILEIRPKFGIYHIANEGRCSWYTFTKKIFELLKQNVRIKAIKTKQLEMSTHRPANSALDNSRIHKLKIKMPKWEDALKRYLIEKGYIGDLVAV